MKKHLLVGAAALLLGLLLSISDMIPAYTTTDEPYAQDLFATSTIEETLDDTEIAEINAPPQENPYFDIDIQGNLPDWAATPTLELPQTYYLQNSDTVPVYSHPTTNAFLTYVAEAGSPCYVLEAYVDGLWHHIFWENCQGYVSTVDLDLSQFPEFSYVFSTAQDMRTKTGYTGAQLEACLADKLSGLGESFAAAEQTYGVNSLFLIAICQLESANGTSKLAVNKNNLAGLKSRSSFVRFSSYSDCIDKLAQMLSVKYLSPSGVFYHGSTIKGVCVTYCNSSAHWINVVSKNMQKNQDKIISNNTAE